MLKSIISITGLFAFLFTACQQAGKQHAVSNEANTHIMEIKNELLIGSWGEPNPINEKQIQGVRINADGSAESVNMATLVYKSWWLENDSLVLVAESIGNGTSSIDTTHFEILKLTGDELELKAKDYSLKYQRQ